MPPQAQGLISLDYFTQYLDAKEKNRILQMIINMMYCSAKSYDTLGCEGWIADNDAQLIRDCETLIQKLANSQKSFVQKPLFGTGVKERGAAVMLGVLSWVDELEEQGVTTPKFEVPAPPTRPASTSASASATTSAPIPK